MFGRRIWFRTPSNIARAVVETVPRDWRALSGHEHRIGRHFSGRCRWTGNSNKIERDLLVLGFVNRSGSNLLADYLRQTRLIHSAGENLNWDTVVNRSNQNGITSFPDYMRFLATAGSAPNIGVKASWEQLAMLTRWNILDMFPQCRVIFIQRRNVIRQAVSVWIARQTKQWTSTQSNSGIEPVYDVKAIAHIMTAIERSNAMMLRLCEILDLPMSTLYYEDLLKDPTGLVRSKLTEIGIDCGPLSFAPAAISRQSDERNEAFVARMKNHLRAELGLELPDDLGGP